MSRQIRLTLNLQVGGRHDAAWKRLPADQARVARSIASLDLVSKGRAGWNIITSQGESKLEALGTNEVLDSEARYRKAEEFTGFGAAWADGLFTSQRTKAHGQQFRSHVHALARAAGRDPDKIVILPGLFVILGGTEAEAHVRKDALDAQLDTEFLLDRLAEQLGIPASEFDLCAELPYDRLVNEPGDVSQYARRREQIVTEARQRGLTARQLLFNNLTGGQRVIIGPPEQVADDIVDWVDSGAADGFTINIDVQTEGLETFVDGVAGELRRRGRFRREYEHQTFRENLGVA